MTTASDWNPEQYRKFATERELPFWELVDLIDAGVRSGGWSTSAVATVH